MIVRVHQLHAHGAGKTAADQARDHREYQVKRPDILVVGRVKVTAPACRMGVAFIVIVGRGCRRHCSDP